MRHRICKVTKVEWQRDYELRVHFDDGLVREIDFSPVLTGELLGPLRDVSLFRRVTIDPEVHTLVWPNGADFDPATLHDWPDYAEAFAERARSIEQASHA
jgi:hypothetical protein